MEDKFSGKLNEMNHKSSDVLKKFTIFFWILKFFTEINDFLKYNYKILKNLTVFWKSWWILKKN